MGEFSDPFRCKLSVITNALYIGIEHVWDILVIDDLALIFLAFSVSFLSIILHILLWRMCAATPSNRTLISLLMVFTLMQYVALVLLNIFGGWELNLKLLPIMMVVSTAIIGCYIASYPAIQANSPTFQISKLIAESGDKGITKNVLYDRLNTSTLVADRIDDLINDKLADNKSGTLLITRRGREVARLFILWRTLLKESKGG